MVAGFHLCFVDDVVLLVSSSNFLLLTPGQFAAKWEVACMRISTLKLEAMVLSWKRVKHPLRDGTSYYPK